MDIERERRWKLSVFPYNQQYFQAIDVTQTYVESNNEYLIRIRRTFNLADSEEVPYYTHTTKYLFKDNNKERIEIENEIIEETYNLLIEFFELPVIHKKRFLYNLPGGLVAEIDWFDDDTIIIEVEFSSEEEMNSFVAPEWFGNKEITDEKSYNLQLFSKLNSNS